MDNISHTDIQNHRTTTTGAEQSRKRKNRILLVVVLAVGPLACYSSQDTKDNSDGASSTGTGTIDAGAGVEPNKTGISHKPDSGRSTTEDVRDLADSGQQQRFDARVLTQVEAGGINDANQVSILDSEPSDTEDGNASEPGAYAKNVLHANSREHYESAGLFPARPCDHLISISWP